MQTLRARFDGDVFIPLEPVKAGKINEAFVMIKDEVESDEEIDWSSLPEEERVEMAEEEFRRKYPEGPLSKKWLKMVGVWPKVTQEERAEELYCILKEEI